MRTTLKRGIGRGDAANGNGRMQLPPGPLDPVTIYRQPEPPPRSRRSLALRILGWAAVVLAVCVTGTAGGVYLWLHKSSSRSRGRGRAGAGGQGRAGSGH